MELNISEFENTSRTANPYENFDYNTYQQNGYNYWETHTNQDNKSQVNQQVNKPKKKKVSFDDILKNMNVVVNDQGVLQYMLPKKETIDQKQNYDSYSHNPYQQPLPQYETQLLPQYKKPLQQYQQPIQVYKQPVNNTTIQSEPIDPSVKHSYIYNKYFSDYIDSNANQAPEIRVPKTKEEYYQMLLDDKIKAEEQRRRIEQMKPRSMLFSSGGHYNIHQPPPPIKPSKNNLRMMNFH